MQKEAFSNSVLWSWRTSHNLYILCQHEATDDVISVTVGLNLEDTRCCFYCDGRSKCHQTETQHCSGNQEYPSKKKKKKKVFYRLCRVKVVSPLSSGLMIEKE